MGLRGRLEPLGCMFMLLPLEVQQINSFDSLDRARFDQISLKCREIRGVIWVVNEWK